MLQVEDLSPWAGGCVFVISNDIVIGPFNYDEQNGYFKIWSSNFGKKVQGGALAALQFFFA